MERIKRRFIYEVLHISTIFLSSDQIDDILCNMNGIQDLQYIEFCKRKTTT